jgi:hypothetical protein
MPGKSHLSAIPSEDVFATGGFTVDPNQTFSALTDVIVFPWSRRAIRTSWCGIASGSMLLGRPSGLGQSSNTTRSAPGRTGASTSPAG